MKIVRAGKVLIAPNGDVEAEGFQFTDGTPLAVKQVLVTAHVRAFLDNTLDSGEIRIIVVEPAYADRPEEFDDAGADQQAAYEDLEEVRQQEERDLAEGRER